MVLNFTFLLSIRGDNPLSSEMEAMPICLLEAHGLNLRCILVEDDSLSAIRLVSSLYRAPSVIADVVERWLI